MFLTENKIGSQKPDAMKTKIKDAAKVLYKNPKLELALIEAVANSLDAGAGRIEIKITGNNTLQGRKSIITDLKVQIKDNGHGFGKASIDRFSSLFNKADDLHRGMGRLAYAAMFEHIQIHSISTDGIKSDFVFTDDMEIKPQPLDRESTDDSGTILTLSQLKVPGVKADEVEPDNIRAQLYREFFIALFRLKKSGKFIELKITSAITSPSGVEIFSGTETKKVIIAPQDVVELKQHVLRIDMIPYNSYYAFVEQREPFRNNFIAFEADHRTKEICKEFSGGNYLGKSAVFIVVSDAGEQLAETDNCRTELMFKDKGLQNKLQEAVKRDLAELAAADVPGFSQHVQTRYSALSRSKPFLSRYIKKDQMGLFPEDKIIDNAYAEQLKARKAFFQNSPVSSEAEFKQRFDFASVILAEYVVGRADALEQMKNLTGKDPELAIHNLLVPMRTMHQGDKDGVDELTNLWMLDERFMGYTYVLSDKRIDELIIKTEGKARNSISTKHAAVRPDIAIVFSGDPEDASVETVDVVIIELKRKGAGKSYLDSIESELMERAYALKDECSKICRTWFYGITDFSESGLEERYLRTKNFVPLFSSGHCYYKSMPLYDKVRQDKPTGVLDFFLMDYHAVFTDAENRLSTFRKVLLQAFNSPQAASADV